MAYISGVAIKSCGIFQQFPHQFTLEVTKILRNRLYAPNDIIFGEHTIGKYLHFI